jgi:hypothetical protein
MKFNRLISLICAGILLNFFPGFCTLNAQVMNAGNETPGEKNRSTVILSYKDTLTLASFSEFDLRVKMKTGYQLSAISLGFYYPPEYLKIDSIVLADNVQGFYYSDTNGLIIIAWSDVNPINIPGEGTLLTLRMNTLDLTKLIGTIKLGLYESSEFADQSANIIEGVELEVPEIQYRVPDDTLFEDLVTVGPNPFYDKLSVYFYLKADSRVSISLIDFSGRVIYPPSERSYLKGHHIIRLDASDISGGKYYLKYESANEIESKVKIITLIALR